MKPQIHAYTNTLHLIDLRDGNWIVAYLEDTFCSYKRYDNHDDAAKMYIRLQAKED